MAAGTSEAVVIELARRMTLKQQLLGLAVDGAKAGLDWEPGLPSSKDVLGRFIGFLRPYLCERLSLGPDRGTTWSALQEAAHASDLASTKLAVARAQDLDPAEFDRRLALLDQPVGGLTLAERRAGHALAEAALVAYRAGKTELRPCRVALQGFGTLGRGAAVSLERAGARLVAVGDELGCVRGPERGIDLGELSRSCARGRLPIPRCWRSGPPEDVFTTDAEVVVLAGGEDTLDMSVASQLRADVVVVGANLGLDPQVESVLGKRGIVVVPDFVAGCGGSASMNELFGAPDLPSAAAVLERAATAVGEVVHAVLQVAERHGISSRLAALAICAARRPPAGRAPYRVGPLRDALGRRVAAGPERTTSAPSSTDGWSRAS